VPAAAVPARRGLWFWAAIAMLCALIPVYVTCLAAPGFGLYHDDGVYVVTAKALAEGKGYAIDSLPDATPQTKYPPLFPLLLSFIWRVNPHFPGNIVALRALPFVSLLAWLWLIFVFARSRIGETPALWICFLVAANQWVIYTSSIVMTESLFGLLTLGSVWLLEKLVRSDSVFVGAAAIGLAVLAYATRTAGVVVFGTGVVTLLLARRWRALVVFALAAVASAGLWSGWQRKSQPAATSIENYYSAQNYRDSAVTSPRFRLPDKVRIVGQNVVYLFTAPLRLFSVPVFRADFAILPTLLLLYWLNGVFWLGAAHGMSKLPVSARLFTGFYLAMILLWVWHPDRLLLPVLPFLLFAFYCGSRKWTFVRFSVPAIAMCAMFAALGTAVMTARHGVTLLGNPLVFFSEEQQVSATDLTEPLDDSRISAVYQWIRENTTNDAVILADFDPAVYLYTGRKGMRPFTADGMPVYYWDDRGYSERQSDLDRVISRHKPAFLVQMGPDAENEIHYTHLLRDLRREGRISLVKEFTPHYRIFRFSGPERHSSQ